MFEISVVIPMYNNEDTILDALESVKKQSAIQYVRQILVVDDGSTDHSYERVEAFRRQNPALPVELYRQENAGASAARNTGLKHAAGNWIAFLDADDEWRENRLERQIQVIEEHPEIDFLGAGHSDAPLRILGKKITGLYKASIRDLAIKFFPTTPTILMRQSIYARIGGYNEAMRYAEDGEYYVRICRSFNYYYLPEHLVDLGHGKKSFGEKGLSGNLRGMYEGNVMIIRGLVQRKDISLPFYLFLRVFYFAKYLRRILITWAARKR